MSITELEIGKWTLQQLEESWERVEHDAVDMRGYWRGRVAELEAAEKEATAPPEFEPDQTQVLHDRVDRLGDQMEVRLNATNAKIEELEKKLKRVPEWDSLDRLVGGLRADLDRGLGSVRADVRADLKHHKHRHGDSGECYSP